MPDMLKSNKRLRNSSTDIDDLPGSLSNNTEVGDLLCSINSCLSSVDARLSLIEVLYKEFQGLRESQEFSQEQITSLTKQNQALQKTVKTLGTQITTTEKENKMKETILDLQSRSMQDNLIFFGLPENIPDDPEKNIKDFMHTHLKLAPEPIQSITFHEFITWEEKIISPNGLASLLLNSSITNIKNLLSAGGES